MMGPNGEQYDISKYSLPISKGEVPFTTAYMAINSELLEPRKTYIIYVQGKEYKIYVKAYIIYVNTYIIYMEEVTMWK